MEITILFVFFFLILVHIFTVVSTFFFAIVLRCFLRFVQVFVTGETFMIRWEIHS